MAESLCSRCLNFRPAEFNERVDKCLRKMFDMNSPEREILNAAEEYHEHCLGKFFVPVEQAAMFDD